MPIIGALLSSLVALIPAALLIYWGSRILDELKNISQSVHDMAASLRDLKPR
jgi:hypothetical protein